MTRAGPGPNSILPHYARQIGKIFNYTTLNIELYHGKLQFCIGDVTLACKWISFRLSLLYRERTYRPKLGLSEFKMFDLIRSVRSFVTYFRLCISLGAG